MTEPKSVFQGDALLGKKGLGKKGLGKKGSDKAGPGNMKVVRHDPVRERKIRLLVLLAVVVLTALAYWLGGRNSVGNHTELEQENTQLQDLKVALEADKEHLAAKLAILERTSKVDREAANNVRLLIRDLEDEKARLNKDLSFYKSILAPEDVSEGVRLHALDLLPGKEDRQFLLRLVVSQVARDNPFLRGTLNVELTGLQGEKKTTLSLLELSGQEKSAPLGFRYFQSFPESRDYMQLELPEGFTPETIKVVIRVRSGGAKSVTKTFDWQQELSSNVGQEQQSSQ